MIYADHNFYRETFCGKTIPQNDFLYFAARASEYIDSVTFDRLEKGVSEEYAEKVKKCCCALAESEFEFEQNRNISSEKNGNYSVTYSARSDDTHNAEKRRITAKYLGNTGLLYRGVD